MQWQGISEFVAVAESESFTGAAKRLTLSTAQVSRQISALEARLSIKLFYRTTRKVSLTQEGEVFYRQCRAVLDDLEAAERGITNLQQTPRGNIKLTAPVTYGEQQVLPLINDFIQDYPDISVSAFLTNQNLDLVEQGYDLAIRIGKLENSSLMAKKLTRRNNYVCASPAYLKQHGIPDSLTDLGGHNCLLGTLDHWCFCHNGAEKNIRVKGNIRYNSGTALVDAALKGIGLVKLPHYYLMQYLETGQLVTVLDKFQQQEEIIWGVYPGNRHLSPKIRLLLDFLADKLA
ncbi:LysR substrate-binding domain-containing protein [Thalassomonas actiniarum]|uniref:LysR family transcriptional regulator n=1 Tax=Thalassomonas actiniarum TaxID=485447 RepID=A0AAE9YWC9_9GAMM|nr:LysR substrate-binding domain-containing protein [Thalassomonas actiniarum]WDE01717.1 LysR family transcriptional regulator [Thalassomonas actiniarum]